MKMYDILKRSLKEVQQPLSQGEKNFKALHNPDYKNLVPGVTDQEHVFNGSAQRKDPKTASYEGNASEKAYDKTLKREEVELDEAVTVKKTTHPWGKMMVVHHGSSHSFPLHPEHQEAIANLKDGENTSFTDETKSKVTAHRDGNTVHLSLRGSNNKTPVAMSHFKEQAEHVDEASKSSMAKPKMYSDTMKKAAKFNSSNISKMQRDEKARKAVMQKEDVEQVDEVLTKKTSMGDTIADFVHSKNPKFAGKSKKERMKQAMAAYYSKQRNEAYEDNDYVADEVSMVRTELKAIVAKAQDMMDKMSQSMHIEPWVQSKIATAKEMVSGVHDYMVYGDDDKTPAAPSYDQSSQMASSYGNFMNRMGEDYVVEKKGDDEDESDRAANKNIINQMRKAPVDGMHKLTFENGKKHMVQPKHVARALEIHANTPVAKGAKEDLQNALGRSHEDFMHVVNHGKAPAKVNKPRVSLGSMKKEDADPTTKQASRGAMNIRVINGRPEFVKASKKEIKVEELVGGQKKLDKNHNGKLDKMDFKLLRKKKKMMESEEMTVSNVAKAAATQTEFGNVGNRNMQQDSVDKIKTDPLASKEKIKLPPTQGNKPIGGDTQTHPNVAEEILLNKLYDTLSEENRIKFESMLESDEGIDALLAFAEEHGI